LSNLALFDLDGTLLDHRPAIRRWAVEYAAAQCLDAEHLITMQQAHIGPVESFFERIGASFDAYVARLPDLLECTADDVAALDRLRASGWRIGIVTNGSVDGQLAKIRGTGLDARVHGWCISEELGTPKPDTAMFRVAAQRAGAELADGGWMVGNSLPEDIEGGRRAGLRTIWIDEFGTGGGEAADYTVTTVAEAIGIMLRDSR
jgi:HAD superfamily hydrolase (TIGR01549 family)